MDVKGAIDLSLMILSKTNSNNNNIKREEKNAHYYNWTINPSWSFLDFYSSPSCTVGVVVTFDETVAIVSNTRHKVPHHTCHICEEELISRIELIKPWRVVSGKNKEFYRFLRIFSVILPLSSSSTWTLHPSWNQNTSSDEWIRIGAFRLHGNYHPTRRNK